MQNSAYASSSPAMSVSFHRLSATPAGEISTSYVERQNLTMRMGMRRFTRLTNGFSKKVENLAHAVSLHYCHYNFARVHQTLGCTPVEQARDVRQRPALVGHASRCAGVHLTT